MRVPDRAVGHNIQLLNIARLTDRYILEAARPLRHLCVPGVLLYFGDVITDWRRSMTQAHREYPCRLVIARLLLPVSINDCTP